MTTPVTIDPRANRRPIPAEQKDIGRQIQQKQGGDHAAQAAIDRIHAPGLAQINRKSDQQRRPAEDDHGGRRQQGPTPRRQGVG